jgi:hypothetical protein
MANPEKLNLWDRLFNRYRKTLYSRGVEKWKQYNVYTGKVYVDYDRVYIEYLIVDRLTGSEEIEKVYL